MRYGLWLPSLLAVALGAPAFGQNLLHNPGFDSDLAGWTFSGNVTWSPLDASGSPGSGSARLGPLTALGEPLTLIEQCLTISDAVDYLFSARLFRADGAQVSAMAQVIWYPNESCVPPLSSANPGFWPAPGVGLWEQDSGMVTPPPGTLSAAVRLSARRQAAGEMIALFDDVVFAPAGSCIEDATTLCLNEGRFRVRSRWITRSGASGDGNAVKLTGDTGYFWFFNAANVELVLKVLDACATPFESFWVFAAGLTNVEVEIEVEDIESELVQIYFNPLDRPFEAIQDTAAFATCP